MNGALTFATKLTILRILLTPLFVMCVMYYDPVTAPMMRWWALSVFGAGVLTDAVDGYLARHHHQWSRLGALLDPIADKILLMSAFLTLSVVSVWPGTSRIPAWVTITVVSRDVLLLVGGAVTYIMTGRLHVHPSIMGKLTTCAQMATVVLVLLFVTAPVLQMCWYVTVALTVFSSVGYLRSGSLQLHLPSSTAVLSDDTAHERRRSAEVPV